MLQVILVLWILSLDNFIIVIIIVTLSKCYLQIQFPDFCCFKLTLFYLSLFYVTYLINLLNTFVLFDKRVSALLRLIGPTQPYIARS